MTIDTTYQDQYSVLFAGNARTITVKGLTANAELSVALSVTSKSDSTMSFSVLADSSGWATIDLDLILKSLPISISVRLSWAKATFTFTSGADTASWSATIIGGQVPSSILTETYKGYRLISARPQVYEISEGVTEYLYRVPDDDGFIRMAAVVYSDIYPPFKVDFSGDSAFGIVQTEVSVATIRKLAEAKGYTDLRILGYDVQLIYDEDAEEVKETLRYTVSNRQRDVFCFKNRMGTGDIIYAEKRRKVEVDTDTQTFVNGEVEEEVSNDSEVQYETFTGYLATREEVRFWQDFFASSERYLNPDGSLSLYRIIVDDVSNEGTEGELNAFSFKWHYADPTDDPGRIPVRNELQQFNVKI